MALSIVKKRFASQHASRHRQSWKKVRAKIAWKSIITGMEFPSWMGSRACHIILPIEIIVEEYIRYVGSSSCHHMMPGHEAAPPPSTTTTTI